MAKKTTEEFIEKARTIHENKYDYSKVVYTGTHNKVTIGCPTHGDFQQSPVSHLRGIDCAKCGFEKKRQTCIDRYGVPNPQQHKSIRRKTMLTNLEKYGDHPSKTASVKEKMVATTKVRYGVRNAFQSEEIKQKSKQTRIRKYGVEFVSQSPQHQETKKQQYFLKHGVEHPMQNPFVKSTRTLNNLKKYGVEHPNQLVEVRERAKQTSLKKYNVEHPNQRHMRDSLLLLESELWMNNQYINLDKTAVQIAEELNVGLTVTLRYLKKHNIQIRPVNKYSHKCLLWLESIIEQEKIHIQHALNGGEYSIPNTPYHADGYCLETNTIYEFYGDYWHGNPKQYNADVVNEVSKKTMGELYQTTLTKEVKLKNLGYNLVVMWESDFTSPT